jgi:hypothetical protein
MKCPKCGTKNPSSYEFCSKCGIRLAWIGGRRMWLLLPIVETERKMSRHVDFDFHPLISDVSYESRSTSCATWLR